MMAKGARKSFSLEVSNVSGFTDGTVVYEMPVLFAEQTRVNLLEALDVRGDEGREIIDVLDRQRVRAVLKGVGPCPDAVSRFETPLLRERADGASRVRRNSPSSDTESKRRGVGGVDRR